MKFGPRHGALAAALLVALLATGSDQGERTNFPGSAKSGGGADARRTAASAIDGWPPQSRTLAAILLEKYGAPDEIVSSQLSWNDRRPWKKVVVFRDPEGAGRSNRLLESVAYGRVPLVRWREFYAFGRGTAYDPSTDELSARTDREETNCLALNLADEVIRGRRTALNARAFYDATLNLALYGKSSPYMSRLLFSPGGRPLPRR